MNEIAGAAMLLASSGAFIDSETLPYINAATYDSDMPRADNVQIRGINEMQYSCEGFDGTKWVEQPLTSCPDVTEIK